MKPKKRRYDYSDRKVWSFRHSEKWKNKAVEIKERDHWMCKNCLKNKIFTYKDLEVHHIIPLEEDINQGLDDENLITLCRSCHEAAEKGEISRQDLRKMIIESI
jgi:5-methylcytosine-specific restriction endonuclease McrA